MGVSARDDRLSALTALAALAEPLRRRLYLHVTSSDAPVSRDGAAEALGVARSVAAFHLDKLAELGVLDTEYRRPPGRSGPGAGRPTKYYRRSERELHFSVPERRYDVAAAILASAVTDATSASIPVDAALHAAARDYGRIIAGDAGDGDGDEVERVLAVLTSHGYEPARRGSGDGESVGDVITLENCPFRALAQAQRGLVCGMNLDVVCGLLEATEAAHIEARLDPAPGRCCVTLGSARSV
jgi:predicted ArsR family transcriptional regulator